MFRRAARSWNVGWRARARADGVRAPFACLVFVFGAHRFLCQPCSACARTHGIDTGGTRDLTTLFDLPVTLNYLVPDIRYEYSYQVLVIVSSHRA